MHNNWPLRILLIAACTVSACSRNDDATLPQQNTDMAVTIMAFNVENLFDNSDDPGKNDATYFAIADKQSDGHKASCATIEVERWREQCLYWDWSDDIVDRKLEAVAAAILQVDDGRGADIIALQEVENIAILERLKDDYLAAAGYRVAILIEDNDSRGIDVAFLSKLPQIGSAALHGIDFPADFAHRVGDTRGILEATFELPDGTLLTAYSVHFPAPYHPTEMREAAYATLNDLQATLPPRRPAIAAGDFNTTASEDKNRDMLGRLARPTWTVAHEQGCQDCPGTNYYAPNGSWSFLDMILWSPGADRGEKTTWKLREDSVYIANKAPGQTRADGTPARFELPDGDGVSDHWPLVVTIESNGNNGL
jgi:endonuclease/exonuclease/phosphatase family metal-dependent hydrolase